MGYLYSKYLYRCHLKGFTKEIHLHKVDESNFYVENNTWEHGDIEFLFKSSTQYIS